MIKLTKTNECYHCKHRQTLPGDTHSLCLNPDPQMTGNRIGIAGGWFMYPYNFDPIWKTKRCKNFKKMDE